MSEERKVFEKIKDQIHEVVQTLEDGERKEIFDEFGEYYCMACGWEYDEDENPAEHTCEDEEEDEEGEDEDEEEDEEDDEEGDDLL